MRTADFDYHLPPEMIAQRPADPRDSSRLLILDRKRETLSHHIFRDLPSFLSPGDALVLNETRVLPARLRGHKIPTGGHVELLLLNRRSSRTWEALVGGKGLVVGRKISLSKEVKAEILEDLGGGRRVVRFNKSISPILNEMGEMPLPPYINTPLKDPNEYQTVFARRPGSAAAPTAGLHFTPEVLRAIETKGVAIVKITLHVGLDTFLPVNEEDPGEHPIHREWCQIAPQAVEVINNARSKGARIVAVGTTTVRTLETAARLTKPDHEVAPFEGATDLYILPGFQFHAVDAMITNFHLPRSTLLMMVSAFAGRDRVLKAYDVAMKEGYRFYSFGDAMLIL
ncbi:MAG TPA: tRNA preQ1(34) S-adenosylmethionine ribosyltransferase-isomerase QueA [Anaerolineae bacterium]|nr:tRNA preQ1(34) S-adenosylmethionine ribosyltransferase-isomerase QueA [Anaerolineae bacterium]